MSKEGRLDFLIMYEVTIREMESIVLLGNELKKRGYSVDYYSFDHANPKLYLQNKKRIEKYYNKVDVVLMPSLYHDAEVYELVHYIVGNCKQIVNLRWEQAFSFKDEADVNGYWYPHGDACKAYHLCWGKSIKETMLKTGTPDEKLLLTGPLHMDFLRPAFENYYFGRDELLAQYGIPTDKKCVLFISSFAVASRTKRQMELEEASAGNALFVDDVVTAEQKSRDKALEWLEEMLRTEDCTVVYRPHPVENVLGDLGELKKKYPNFFVVSEHSVKQWILRCDVVTTWISTSIAEAYFAGKPCITMRPYAIPREKEMCLYDNAVLFDSKETFLQAVKENSQVAIDGEVIRRYYDVTEVPSYIRLSDELERILKDEKDVFPWDESKIAAADKKIKGHLLQSILLYAYLPLMRFLVKWREKSGVSFGNKINARVDSFGTAQKKLFVRVAEPETIRALSERIAQFM